MNSNIITAIRYDSSLKPQWDAFVEESRNATFLFKRDYMDYHASRFTDASLLFYKKEELVGLLPANMAGDVLSSHSGLTYGGLLISLRATMEDVFLMFAAMRKYLLANTDVGKIIYRPIPYIYHKYPCEEDLYALFRCNARLIERKISSVIWLKDALPFNALRRRKIKRAEKAGFKIIADGDFKAFWMVLQENLQNVHNVAPVHSLAEIELLAGRFPENIKLYRVVDGEGATVAGAVFYLAQRVAHVQYIGSVQKGRDNGALDFLFHSLVYGEYAHMDYFDFGISVEDGGRFLNKGLIFQKEGFGGRAVVYDTYEFNINDIPND